MRRARGTRHAEAVVEHASLGVPCNRPGGARRRPRTEAVHGEDPRPRVFVAVLCVRAAQVRTGPADFEKEPGLRIVDRRTYGSCESQQARRHVGGKNPLRSKASGADRGKGSGPEAPRPISIERVEKEVVRRRNRPELREPPLRPDAETCVGHGLHGRQGRNVGNQQVFAAQVQIDLRGVEFVGQKPESRQGYDDREGLCVPSSVRDMRSLRSASASSCPRAPPSETANPAPLFTSRSSSPSVSLNFARASSILTKRLFL